MNNPFQSLKNKNYRLYWQFMSLFSLGIWIKGAAQPWLAYYMTDSPLMLGIVSALQFLPILFFSLFAGVAIDRFSKRKILLITQFGYICVSALMAFLILSERMRYDLLLVTAAFTGFLNVFNMPLRQTLINQLVPKQDLMNAVALYSISFNLCRIIGPALVGLLTAKWGIGVCFVVNTVIYVISTIGLFFVKLPQDNKKLYRVTFKAVWNDIQQGLKYACERRHIYEILIMLAITGIFSINFSVLIPVISVEIMRSDALGFGALMSVMGIGTFIGAFWVALHSKQGPQKFFLYIAPLILAALWIIVYLSEGVIIYISVALIGFFFISFSSTANAALQLRTEQEYLGRIISLNTLVLAGTAPIGSLYSGFWADFLGVRWGAFFCGLAALFCFIAYWFFQGQISRRDRGNSLRQ